VEGIGSKKVTAGGRWSGAKRKKKDPRGGGRKEKTLFHYHGTKTGGRRSGRWG